MTISRRDAFRVAADVLERSDWLTVDLLADLGDENASENADRIVEILREEVARMGAVPATAPPPSGAAGAPTPDGPLCTCPETDPVKRAGLYTVARLGMEPHAVGCPRWGMVPVAVSDGAPTYATGGYVGPVDEARIRDTLRAASDRAHALPAYARPTVTRPVSNGATSARTYFAGGPVGASSSRRERTSGPLDPEIHAALVRSVERGRLRQPDGVLSREEIDAYYAEHPEEVTPEALAASRAAQDVLAVRQQVREDIRADFLNDDGLSPWER